MHCRAVAIEIVVFTIVLTLSSVVTAQVEYTVIDLGTLGPVPVGPGYSLAADVNNAGVVVGESAVESQFHAFYWDGEMHDLGTFGGPSSRATAINDAGQITGWASLPSFAARAFIYDGTMHDLDVLPGGSFSYGYDINNSGEVVGMSLTAGGTSIGFIADLAGGMTEFGPPSFATIYGINDPGWIIAADALYETYFYDGSLTLLVDETGDPGPIPNDLNNAGHVVGRNWGGLWFGEETDHAFLIDEAGYHDLGILGGLHHTVALAINESDQIVGYAQINLEAVGSRRAIIYDAAHGMRDLNNLISPSAGLVLHSANGINDLGQIAGSAWTSGFPSTLHAVLLTPISMPDTFSRGDVNGDDTLDIADPIQVLQHLFVDFLPLPCDDAADANDDSALDIADALTLFSYLFQSGFPPSPPGPGACGSDPTSDGLDCATGNCP